MIELRRLARSLVVLYKSPSVGYSYFQVAGCCTIISSAISLGISIVCYQYFDDFNAGSWWSSMIVLLSGFFALLSWNYSLVSLLSIISCVSFGLCLAGIIVDASSLEFISSLKTCVDPDYHVFGSDSSSNSAKNCYYKDYSTPADCYCTDASDKCFIFNGQSNCNLLFKRFTPLLITLVAFDGFNFIMTCILCGLSIMATCYPTHFKNWLYPPPSPEPSSCESFEGLQDVDSVHESEDGFEIQMSVNPEKSKRFLYSPSRNQEAPIFD